MNDYVWIISEIWKSFMSKKKIPIQRTGHLRQKMKPENADGGGENTTKIILLWYIKVACIIILGN